MSILFDSASDNVRTTATPASVPGAVGSISFWYKGNFVAGDAIDHFALAWDLGGAEMFLLPKDGSDQINVGWNAGAGTIKVSSTGIYKKGIWQHLLYTWDANGQDCYIDGRAVIISSSAPTTSSNNTEETIGNNGSGHTNTNFNGSIAEVARWDIRLGPREANLLAQGFSPLGIQPVSRLKEYERCPGVGLAPCPEYDTIDPNKALTATATTFDGDGPPLRPYPPPTPAYRLVGGSSATHITLVQRSWNWTGTPLLVNAKTHVTLTQKTWAWTGTALKVTFKVHLVQQPWLWSGTALRVALKLHLIQKAWSWTGTALVLNLKTDIRLIKQTWAWTGTALGVHATTFIKMAQAIWHWGGNPIKLPGHDAGQCEERDITRGDILSQIWCHIMGNAR